MIAATAENAGTVGILFGLIGLVVGWLGSSFGLGMWIGKLQSKMTASDKRHDVNEKKLEEHDTRFETLLASFTKAFETEGGDPRYVTYPAHDEMRATCQARMALQMTHYSEGTAGIKEDFKVFAGSIRSDMSAISASVQQLALAQAREEGRRHRSTDDAPSQGATS